MNMTANANFFKLQLTDNKLLITGMYYNLLFNLAVKDEVLYIENVQHSIHVYENEMEVLREISLIKSSFECMLAFTDYDTYLNYALDCISVIESIDKEKEEKLKENVFNELFKWRMEE